jgi:tRNA pseudouridine13 synthase
MNLVKTLEQDISAQVSLLANGLAAAGLKQERRPLRLVPENLQITPADAGKLVLEFSLPKGAFATSVLREMVKAPGL